MTVARGTIPDFQLANPIYAGASVSFYTVDGSGVSTGVLATLYANPLSATTATNPQVLDADGKFAAPVYIDVSVIGVAVGPNVASHATGVISTASASQGLTITPSAASLGQGFAVTQTGPTTGNQNAHVVFNSINLTEAVNSGAADNTVNALNIKHSFGGPNASGSREALELELDFTAPTSATNTNRNYLALYPQVNVNSGDGGTNTGAGAKGVFSAINPVVRLKAGATYIAGASGGEIDITTEAGCSVRDINGLNFVYWGPVQAANKAVGLGFFNAGDPTVSWSKIIELSSGNGGPPLTTTGSIISTDGTPFTIANGIDLSPCIITGNFLLGPSSLFAVSGAGATTTTALSIVNAAGVIRGIYVPSTDFGGSIEAGTTSNHPFVFKSNNTIAGYFDTSQVLNLGVAGISQGALALHGLTSGAVTLGVQAVAGAYNFNYPSGAGSSGQPLLSGGGGATAQSYGTLGPAAGGTGVTNNAASTLTISGNFGTTLTIAGVTNATLPSGSHTLAGLDVGQTFTADQTISGKSLVFTGSDPVVLSAQSVFGYSGSLRLAAGAGGIIFNNSNVSANLLTVTNAGSVVVGNAALATNATDGFLYISTCAGTPTGTPSAFAGRAAMIYDTTNHKFYIYDGGWKGGTNPGAFT